MPNRPEIYQKFAMEKFQKLAETKAIASQHLEEKKKTLFMELLSFLKGLVKDLYKKVVIKLNLVDLKITPYDTNEVLKARKKQIEKQSKVYSTIQIKTAERERLRQAIENEFPYKEVSKEGKAFIVLGLPGSGKSSKLEDKLLKDHNALKIDYDEIKPKLPEYDEDGTGNYIVYEEAKLINNKVLDRAITLHANVVICNPGLEYLDLENKLERLKKQEYEVYLYLVLVDPEVAARRSIQRFKEKGRFTDPIIHYSGANKPLENFKTLINEHRSWITSYKAFDNNVGKDEPMRELSEQALELYEQ